MVSVWTDIRMIWLHIRDSSLSIQVMHVLLKFKDLRDHVSQRKDITSINLFQRR